MRFFSRCFGLIVFAGFILFFAPKVLAQSDTQTTDNVEYTQPIGSDSTVTITGTAQLPDPSFPTTIIGRGEPGAEIEFTVLANDAILFNQTTTVGSDGKWRVVVPALNTTPTTIVVRSETPATTTKIIETTAVTTLVAANSLIVLQLVLERLVQSLQVFGLFGRKRTRGFVYDLATKKPVPFVELTIETVAIGVKTASKLKETVVSSVDGFFRTVDLPPGNYQLTAAHSGFTFPVKVAKPWYANPLQFYQGEPIALDSQEALQIVFIPMQAREGGKSSPLYWLNARVLMNVLVQLARMLALPMGIISAIILLIYPSFINFLIASIYIVFAIEWLIRYYSRRGLKGKVLDAQNKPIANAVVRVFRTNPEDKGLSEGLVAVVLSNKDGEFKLRVTPGKYQIIVNKEGLVATENQGMSYEAVNVTKSVDHLQYHLLPIQQAVKQAGGMQGSPMAT